MLSRWYRTGVIYSLDIGLFQDANGDGIGDIQGLISRLDYLANLRVTTIWLNPIHPSPAAGRRVRHHRIFRGAPAIRAVLWATSRY